MTGFVEIAMYEMQVPAEALEELRPQLESASSYESLAETLRPYFSLITEINERMTYDLSLKQVPDLGKLMEGMWRNYDYFAKQVADRLSPTYGINLGMTEAELNRLAQELPRMWLEYPYSVENFLRDQTQMPEENIPAAMQHIVNKCIDGMRNTMRFVLAYRELDVQALLTMMSLTFGLQKFDSEIDQVELMYRLMELGYTMHYREEPKEQEFVMPPPD